MNPELFYYDVLISNLNNQNISSLPAQYQETRQQAFLAKPSLYKMSVVRWTADTTSLPIWRCQIKPDAIDANDSIYSITFNYLGVSYQAYLQYQSQNLVTPVPPPPSKLNGTQSNSNLYYDVYSYQYVVYLFNQLLIDVFNLLPSAISDLTFPPSMIYNPDNKTISLYCDSAYYSNVNTVDPQISIFFNPATANLFSSFPFFINKFISTTGENYQLITDIFGLSNLSPYPPSSAVGSATYKYEALVIYQEYSTVAQWNPVVSLVMTSTSLPVAPNAVSGVINQQNINGQSIPVNGASNNLVYPIITDFSIDATIGFKPFIYYVPTAQYRYIELLGSTPLTNIDIALFWKDRTGQLNTFILAGTASISIKLLFELK